MRPLSAVRSRTWCSFVEPSLAERAQTVAVMVATALRDPASVARTRHAGDGEQVSAGPEDFASRAPTLAGGHTGIALLAADLDVCLPGAGWDEVAHAHLVAAISNGLLLQRLGPSLHGGWAGLVYTADALSRGGRRYRRLLQRAET